MSQNDPSAQMNVSNDRGDSPDAAREHVGAPAPEEVERPAPTPRGSGCRRRADSQHRGRRPRGDGVEPRPQPRQPRGQHRRDLQPQPREDRHADRPRIPRRSSSRRTRTRSSRRRSQKPRTAIIMVKAGAGTDAVIDALVNVFEPGDIIVDGGNALFTDTIRREKAVRETGINFVGAGISGGEEGALLGPSIMPGGSDESWVTLGPDPEVDRGDRRGRAVRDPHRPRRRRPLREDGAQRHRVRRHAAHRRGVRPHPPRHRQDSRRDRRRVRRVERAASSSRT